MDRSLEEMAETELIAQARAGDASAYGALYQRHAEAAARLARQITGNQADADDVAAETFARVLSAMRNGNGPSEAFRPYLLMALRRVAFDHVRGQRRQIPTEEADLPDPGEAFVDPVIAGLDRELIAQAFRSLPERWSAVLWHTEVEQASLAEVAALLGMSPGSVAALRYRAREGLRQAYLQLHLSERAKASCRPIAGKLATYVRGKLSGRQAREVESHLSRCQECTAACADLAAINSGLRGMLGPGVAALAGLRFALSRFLRFLGHRPILPITALAAAASVAVPAFTLVHAPREHLGTGPLPAIARTTQASQRANAPAPAAAEQPSPSELPSPAPSEHERPRPTPSRHNSSSPHPAPTSPGPTSPTSPTPTSPASPQPTPTPTPTATVKVTAELSVGISINGLLDLGVTALVKVDVSDPGNGATGPLTATVNLPAGISLLGLTGTGDWSCGTGSPLTCTHPAVAAGASANLSFNVLVVTLSGCGDSIAATVASGALSATGVSAKQVACPPPLL
jgi:RNA polymerase sigma factor (sigma-70 family)